MTTIAARPLHPPGDADPLAAIYKEWLHVNVFDHDSGLVGLVNVSLHGNPAHRRAVAMGTALFHLPGHDWQWHVDIQPANTVSLGWASIAMPDHAVAAELPEHRVAASVRSADLTVRLEGTPVAEVFDVPARLPFGSGWISWTVLPRLRLGGTMTVAGRTIELGGASGYHDRNWGRWRWGDDAGWEWGAFLAPAPAPAIVLSRATDRTHHTGEWLVSVHDDRRRTLFWDGTVTTHRHGRFDGPMPRLPGAMAALHGSRRRPALPTRVVTTVRDVRSWLDIEFTVRAAAQIIAGEPTSPGYTFLHELVGEFSCHGSLAGEPVELTGLGVFEYVD